MISKVVKQFFKNIFKGVVLPVFSDQLKGMRLKVDPVIPGNLFFNNVEVEMHAAYDTFIKDGDIVFDIGANVGLHSYYFARKFKDCKVYSFEPLPDNIRYFKEMVALNRINNITVIEKAIGAKVGVTYFDTSVNSAQGHITEEKSGLSVAVTTLDNFIQSENIFPAFIKIDIEGGEVEALAGFAEMIEKVSPFMIIEIHTLALGESVARFFEPRDFVIFRLKSMKHWKANNKQFTRIKKITTGSQDHQDGLWGMIMVLPKSKSEPYLHLAD